MSVNVVSPTWGREITKKAIRALIVVLHPDHALHLDPLRVAHGRGRARWPWSTTCFISVGIYSIFGFEVTPATVIAFLTILGFSLYDTIVVFDKVHENTKR